MCLYVCVCLFAQNVPLILNQEISNITKYLGLSKPSVAINICASLPDEFSNFYTSFETHNLEPVAAPQSPPNETGLQVTETDLKTVQRIRTHRFVCIPAILHTLFIILFTYCSRWCYIISLHAALVYLEIKNT